MSLGVPQKGKNRKQTPYDVIRTESSELSFLGLLGACFPHRNTDIKHFPEETG